METLIILATISASAILLTSALTFYLTKQKEHEAEWRRQKLEHYKELTAALNGIAAKEAKIEDRICFAEAANNIWLIGAPKVLVALPAYLLETAKPPNRPDYTEHDRTLTALIVALRKGIGLLGSLPVPDFILWSTNPREKGEP